MARFTRADIRRILGEAHTEEIENQIMALHLGVVDGLKDSLSKAQADAEQLPKVQAELEKLKNNSQTDEFKTKYEKEHADFETFKAEVAKEKTLATKKSILSKIAKDAGLSEAGIAKALKYSNYDEIELDDKGEAKDSKAILDSLKTEWADYVQTEGENGANTPNPPGNPGGGSYGNMSLAEKMQRLNSHPEERQAILDSIK